MPADRHPKQRFRPIDRTASSDQRPQYQVQRGGRMLDPDLMDYWDDQDGTRDVARGLWRPTDDGDD